MIAESTGRRVARIAQSVPGIFRRRIHDAAKPQPNAGRTILSVIKTSRRTGLSVLQIACGSIRSRIVVLQFVRRLVRSRNRRSRDSPSNANAESARLLLSLTALLLLRYWQTRPCHFPIRITLKARIVRSKRRIPPEWRPAIQRSSNTTRRS